MGWHRPLAGIAVVIAVTGLAGCAAQKPADTLADTVADTATSQSSPPGSSSASPSSDQSSVESSGTSPTATQAPRTANWTTLQPGDCLADAPPTDPAVVTVTLVDCAQPHLSETFLRAPLPVDAAVEGTASAQCEAGFVQYTGRASAGSPYVVGYLIDSYQDRTGNVPLPSTLICLLQGAQGQSLNGSAKP